MQVAKARKPKGKSQHSWRVTRRNNQFVTITADGLSVVDGDLVFVKDNVPVRVISADTYTDVELVDDADN
jgi:hypothetical protein